MLTIQLQVAKDRRITVKCPASLVVWLILLLLA